MSIVRESGEVGYEARRYWRRASTSRPWWPWGTIRVVCLLALFVFGAIVTSPQLPAEIKRQVLGQMANVTAAPTDTTTIGRGLDSTRVQPVSTTGSGQNDTVFKLQGE